MNLSTHILDTEAGEPTAGVKVGLYRGNDLISLQETNEDGRIANLFEASFEPGGKRRLAHQRRQELAVALATEPFERGLPRSVGERVQGPLAKRPCGVVALGTGHQDEQDGRPLGELEQALDERERGGIGPVQVI